MEGLQFKVGRKLFDQTNSEQALKLYQTVRNFAGLTGKEVVYDLYSGTGTIANYIARESNKVIGIEYIAKPLRMRQIIQFSTIYPILLFSRVILKMY